MIDLGNGITFEGSSKINLILGKNGTGKSTTLRMIDQYYEQGIDCVRYISPERGGNLSFHGDIQTNITNIVNWMPNQRRKNQWGQFRESSVAEFRNLEILALRAIESDYTMRNSSFTFDSVVNSINTVLDRIEISRSDKSGFEILDKIDKTKIDPNRISSGESELISLAIEISYFSYLCKQQKHINTNNWLLLDEPDVHLHPDLQQRLICLLVDSIADINGSVIIATHSTAILSTLFALKPDTRICLKKYSDNHLIFRRADEAFTKILPMFGAHPLSSVFNEKPPLIVEGEDDERIWQSAVRHSAGRIAVYPCVVGDIQSMSSFETAASELIDAVYENAVAVSLRDRDDVSNEIDNLGPVIRCRLQCRNAENLIVTDDTLHELGTNWNDLKTGIEKWIDDNPTHPRYADAIAFRDSKWDRNSAQLKGLRMVLIGITGSTKPWEVAVGRSIANLNQGCFNGPNSLKEYLGSKLIAALRLAD